MDLDRGTLAKIDRRILAALGGDDAYRIVRVPISEVTWSIWKRYCAALGLSMGRGIAGLISQELETIGTPGFALCADVGRSCRFRFRRQDAM